MERDDIIEYSVYNHHGDEEGRKIRKKIAFVTILLTVITVLEVAIGIYFNRRVLGADSGWWASIKVFYIVLTLVKAGYIVMTFMHLGDERRNIRLIILVPYAMFIVYLIWIALVESNYINMLLRLYE